MKKNDLKRQYVELQLIDQQIKRLQQQLLILEQQTLELAALHAHLGSLEEVREKTKAYVTLGPGVFIEATLDEAKHVLVDVGAEVRVKKTIPETQKTIQEQLHELQKVTKNMEEQITTFLTHAQKLQQEIESKDSA